NNGLKIGTFNFSSPVQFAQRTSIDQNENITTQCTIALTSELTTPNVYNKTKVNNLLAPKATAVYASCTSLSLNANQLKITTALGLKSNQCTTDTTEIKLIIY
ncbi:MAG: hypothetical protein ACKPKO_52825, partial [Candidatus Fonsibacter sp.]